MTKIDEIRERYGIGPLPWHGQEGRDIKILFAEIDRLEDRISDLESDLEYQLKTTRGWRQEAERLGMVVDNLRYELGNEQETVKALKRQLADKSTTDPKLGSDAG